ncbi:unnamed protein product [marine sediment metagenome]|uniref:Uncharacterized protein n=1 Tax=marine sediment metagenome TaxID=412755 RepID=X1QQ63_9ZZZZ
MIYINGVAIVGDMTKAVYDPDLDGLIALAQLVAAVCSETEADNKIAAAIPTVVRKAADQSVNDSTILESDSHLFLPVEANEVWLFQLHLLLFAVAGNVPDWKFGFSYPVNCLLYWGAIADAEPGGKNWMPEAITADPASLNIQTDTPTYGSNNNIHGTTLQVLVVNGANAGNVTFQFAQKTATAGDNTVKENSCLIAHKLA